MVTSARPSWRSRCTPVATSPITISSDTASSCASRFIGGTTGASVALNPPPAASGALIAFGLAYLETLTEHGRSIDALALRGAMEATNAARATHGEGLAQRLAGGALKNEMREAARHPQAYRGTTHVSVIDADGNAASVSLSNGEGNGYIVGKFGFMLNNMLGEEDLSAAASRRGAKARACRP